MQHTVAIDRQGWLALRGSLKALRARTYDLAIDFQGLYKSAIVGSSARPGTLLGFDRTQLREPLAGLFYHRTVRAAGVHVVDRNLELAAAAGAPTRVLGAPLPPGTQEAELPHGPFVLASPLAGWVSKQWPAQHFAKLAKLLEQRFAMPLVVDVPRGFSMGDLAPAIPHQSSIAGLIYATRQAMAVVGVDSGPLHLAAALGKPGVAIFGPTDPARNGPYGGTMTVLRTAGVKTTYKRGTEIDAAMAAISPEAVLDALAERLR